ncbi:hypothetical protein FSP39_001389 [Pinctada imbricata]|uniref:Tyr recombinase domain-containing protein n=1 Tax=Pinctada imbricata TaxID=66713 RepID=A0AA89C6C0_PINIB|nr:hypothetical protein FSP39_001389 [Pinctada imbricata]
MFLAMLKKIKKEGCDKTKHHLPISEADLEILRNCGVFSTDCPKSLQRKVWFDITLNFARRGRENLRQLKFDCFNFAQDENGCEYVEMAYNESTKNHQGDNLKDRDFECRPRMYASGGASCPISSLRKYLELRNPKTDHLFQRPKDSVQNGVWYNSAPIGERTLNDMMKVISKDAGLSRVYTNHCVRATTITLLSHAGVETREIMKISGHRNESSIRSYNTDSSSTQKRAYSGIIQGQKPALPPSAAAGSEQQMLQLQNSNQVPAVIDQRHFANSYGFLNQVANHRQFDIHNSVVHVHNYYGGNQSA